MARKIVDIGVEGNDGTGDSIREAFRKTNDNFRELYAIFGQEGSLSFLDLGDTPDTYTGAQNKLLAVSNQAPYSLQFKSLIGAGGITVQFTTDNIVITQSTAITKLGTDGSDGSPATGGRFGNHINAGQFLLGNLANLSNEQQAQAKLNEWNLAFPTSTKTNLDSFAISKGYADSRYVNTNGDLMTGYLNVPAGASGSQVPRASETVLKTGGTMSGSLYLNDHPGELAGAGTPNGAEDLRAATKYYVDNTAYASKVNLYVSTDGDDSQRGVPAGKEGRAWGYAYRSVGAACLKAEQLIKSSPWELGPYRQLIAFNNGENYSEITSIQPRQGINSSTRIKFTNNNGNPVDQGDPGNRDIVPGKLVVGRTSGARGFIVKYDNAESEDFVDLRDITGAFELGENLFFDNPVKVLEISIFVESGVYFEDLPIRLPQNTSLLGDEFRRTVIRPADRPSKSPWVTTWFFRDTEFDGLTTAETNWGYHYLTDPTNKSSTPKNNRDLDVFLCNDATIIRQVSCQGHGGFMMVLDPEGQILTKSPYCQQSGSFAGSLNKQRFAGGQYVDGMAGSMPVTYVSKGIDNDRVTIKDAFREPTTPTAFFVNGRRYKVDTYTYSESPTPYPNAKELLQANRDFIISETLAYVGEVVTPTFTYDRVKCSRDLAFIINAISWDFVFGITTPTNKASNLQTVLVAQAYFLRESYSLYNSAQKSATKVALDYLKTKLLALTDNNAVAKTRVEQNFNLLFNVLDIGIEEISFTPGTAWSYLGTTITVNVNNHGLKQGWPITVSGVVVGSGATNPPNGDYTISEVPNANSFKYVVSSAPTGAFIGSMKVTVNSIPEYYIPPPIPVYDIVNPLLVTNTSEFNSYDVLIGNREFITAEYISAAIAFFTNDGLEPTFTASVFKRDIERLYNAAIYDSVLGGNSQTVTVLRSFFSNSGNYDKLITIDQPAMSEALTHIINIIDEVATNTDAPIYKQSVVSQFKLTGSPTFASFITNGIKTKFELAKTVVNGSFIDIPAPANPSTTRVNRNLIDSKTLVDVSAPSLRTEIINYIDDQFLYDTFGASIDIGFLIDAVSHDIVYGGNLKVTEHALNYYVAEAEKVSDAERTRTRLIINYVYELAKLIVDNEPIPDTGTVKRRQFQIRQQTRTNFAAGNAPSVVEPSQSWVAADLKTAVQAIELSKTTIINNVIATITATYPNLNYDTFTCARDLEIILDSVKWDVLFNSDYQTVKSAMAYFRGLETGSNTPIYPAFSSGTTKAATLTALTQLKAQINLFLTNVQNSSTAATRYGSSIDKIFDILNGGTTSVPGGFNNTTFVYIGLPSNYNTDYPGYGVAKTQLALNKEFIVEEVVAWIAYQASQNVTPFNTLTYNVDKCKRDIRFIIDAVRYDLTYGGNLATIQAGDSYYVNSVLQLGSAAEQEATKLTFQRLKTVVGWVVTNTSIAGLANEKRSSATQNTTDSSNAGATAQAFAQARVQEIVDTVSITSVDAKPRLEVLFNKVTSIVDGVYNFSNNVYTLPLLPVVGNSTVKKPSIENRLETRDLITLNRSYIKEEVVSYLDYKYSWRVTASSQSTDRFTIGQGVVGNLYVGMPVEFFSANGFDVEILSATTPSLIVGGDFNGKYRVTFTFPQQPATPDSTIEYEIYNQSANNYNTSAEIFYTVVSGVQQKSITRSTITLVFSIDPTELADWVWDEDSPSRLRAAGGIFGGVTRDNKYYVKTISGNQFTIAATPGGSTIQLSEDSSPTGMIAKLSYNRDTCSRDVGFIVSNIATDILYGGNLNTVKVALRYYAATAALVLSEQKAVTIDGIGYIYSLLEKVIFNETHTTFTNVVSSGTTVTVNSTASLKVGMTVEKVSGTGEFAVGTTVITAILSGTTFSVNATPTIPLTTATIRITNDYQLVYEQFLRNAVLSGADLIAFNLDKVFQVTDPNLNSQLDTLQKESLKTELSTLIDLVNDIIDQGSSAVPTTKTELPTYVLILNEDTKVVTSEWTLAPGDEIIIQSAGNTSMLSNDWTQLNDLGYGLIATNNGLLETVSVFTYYCWTAFYARNGGQIRSVGGSNAHGQYGLVAEGNDPFEVPDAVELVDDMVQTAKVYKDGPYSSDMAVNQTIVYIDSYGHLPYNISELEINHSYYRDQTGKLIDAGITRYEISNINDVSTNVFSVTNPSSVSQSDENTPSSIPFLVGGKYRLRFKFASKNYIPPIGKKYIISGATGGSADNYNNAGSGALGPVAGWDCVAADLTTITLEFTAVNFGSISIATTTTITMAPASILKLNLNTGGNNNTAASGLLADLSNGQIVTIRSNQNFKFKNVNEVNPVRPSTALTFRGDPKDDENAPVYRVLAFVTKNPLSRPLISEFTTFTNSSSSGTTITVDSTETLRVGMTVEKVSGTGTGTGAIASGTTITQILTATTFSVNQAPATPLSGATIRTTSTYKNEIILSFDSSFDYVDLAVYQDFTKKTEVEALIENGSGTRTLGSKNGDKHIAIKKIGSALDIERLKTGEMCFAWNGRVHRVVDYFTRTIQGTLIGVVEISESRKSNPAETYQNTFGNSIPTGLTAPVAYSGGFIVSGASYSAGSQSITYTIVVPATQTTALPAVQYQVKGNSNTAYNLTATPSATTASSITFSGVAVDPGVFNASSVTRIIQSTELFNDTLVNGSTVTLKAGLSKEEPADIIVNISTCRATSHDFLDIGSGGYNTTNYPSKIYGPGRAKKQKNEVRERTTGRVFWVSTDQDGFFRIGRFFTVDQGTGTVSFAASLALSNLDGLGFKRGRAISEFSDDPTFQDLADDAVPTEGAVDEYLNRRLGLDREGTAIDQGNLIGPGYLDRSGKLSATANINMGSNKLINLASPNGTVEEDAVAATQLTVRSQELSNDRVLVTGKADNDILVWDSPLGKWVNARSSSKNSQIQIDLVASNSNEINISVKREQLDNSHISPNASIEQQKLDINKTTTQRNSSTVITSVVTSDNGSFNYAVFNDASSDVTRVGTTPIIDVKFQLDGAVPNTPRVGINYNIYNNTNTKYAGTYYAVASAAQVGLTRGFITLRYSEDPGLIAVADDTRIVAHETRITTNLPHGLAVNDTVEISGVTTTAGIQSLNGTWKVLEIISTTEFTINLNTYQCTYNLTTAAITKLGLAAFNKGQFTVSNGFVGIDNSSYNTFSGNVDISVANKITNINTASMAFMSIGSVIRIVNDTTSTVKNPFTTQIVGNYESISLPVIQTIIAIDTDSITLSSNFSGTGTVNGLQFAVISGVSLNSLQQIPRNTVIGNLTGVDGASRTPTLITTQQIVEAGDGIKNVEFNNAVLTEITSNGASTVKGLMTIVKSEPDSRDNDYGVIAITQTGENSKIVMTNGSGHITAKEFILDANKVIAKNVTDSSVRLYTPGNSRVLTASGNETEPANATIYLGAFNDSVPSQVNPLGNVYLPSITTFGLVTLSPDKTNVLIKPTRSDGLVGGTVEISPAIVGKIDNMQIGSTVATTAKFTTIEGQTQNLTSDADSTALGNGALVVAGGASVAKSLNVGDNLNVKGNLFVEGNTVTLDSSTLTIDDKIVRLGQVIAKTGLSGSITGLVVTNTSTTGLLPGMTLAKQGTQPGDFGLGAKISVINSATSFTFTTGSTATNGLVNFDVGGASDITADGGGLILKGATDKSIIWDDTNDNWTSSEHWNIATGKEYKINNVTVLNTSTILGAGVAITIGGDSSTGLTIGGTALTSVNIGSNVTAANTVTIGGAVTNNTVKISSIAAGTINLTTDVTTGIANVFTSLTTGTMNIGSTAGGKIAVAFNTTSTSKLTGALTVGGGVGINENLNVGGKIKNDDTTDATVTGAGTEESPYVKGGSVVTDGGMVVSKKLIVLGSVEFKNGMTVTGDLTGTAANVKTVKNENSGDKFISFVGSNHTTSAASDVYTSPNLKFDPLADKSGKLTTGLFKGDLEGTADIAKKAYTKTGGTHNTSKHLVYVDSDNSEAAAEDLYTKPGLTFKEDTGTLETTIFKGTLDGNAGSATKIFTKSNDSSETVAYLTFVDSNNQPPPGGGTHVGTSEDLRTAANIQIIPKVAGTTNTSRLIVGEVHANVTGSLTGGIKNSENENVLEINNDPALSTFAGNSATASSWKFPKKIKLIGGVTTGEISLNAGASLEEGVLEITATVASGNSASNITATSTTVDLLHYPIFVAAANGTAQSALANSATGGLSYNPANQILYSTTFSGTATRANYADLAEKYISDIKYEPGTVVIFGGNNEITISSEFNDRRVAGVVSTNPGYVMNDSLKGDTIIELALTGRVPCKVVGKVKKGDLMVTSGVPGHAIVNNDPKIGTVIGKALEDKTTDGRGIIEVVVGRV